MDALRWERMRDLFARALELPPAERDAFLRLHCDDDALRSEIQSLLDAGDREGPLDALAQRFTPVRDVLTEPTPRNVGPYVVTDRIGQGGMAVVYRAFDPRLQRDVALKFLPASLHDHSPAADRLMAEARAASALDHPNICTIYDIASADDDRLFIAMAYYAGGTLQDRLRHGPLAPADAIDVARQVAAALQRAHEAGIVHRDIKPANIAFGERGVVKVLDFGVAVLAADADAADAAVPTAGTPSYMSPEQVRGEPADGRSDIWALGVVLYETVSGERPFAGSSRSAIHDEILHADPAPITSLRAGTPQRLADIIERALAKDPALRFQSAAELADALEGVRAALLPARSLARRAVYSAAALVLLLAGISAIARVRTAGDASPGIAPRSSIEEQYLRARARYYVGTVEGNEAAIVILRSIVARDSSHAPSRALLASAYALSTASELPRRGMTEWIDSATAHANAAIAIQPSAPHGHAALGVVYRWAGRLEDAVAQHQRALSLDRQYAESMLELGFVTHLLRRYDEAVIWLERGLAIEPHVIVARRYASTLYRALDMHTEARRHVEAVRLISPDDPSILLESVLIALETGDTAAARVDFEAFIQLVSPGERERLYAWYHILRGDPHAARVHMDRVSLVNAPWYDLREFGVAYIKTGDRPRGEAILQRALAEIEASTGLPEWGLTNPGRDRALIYAILGNREASIAALQEWFDNGGMASSRRISREPAWATVADDPRFLDLIRRGEERLNEKRAGVAAELSRLRD